MSENWKEDYDWQAAFEYAGNPTEYGWGNSSPNITSVDKAVVTPFGVINVVEVHAKSDGENDEQSWIMWGKLDDGRHFFLDAWCDYTGWDCRADGEAYVAQEKDVLIATAMTIEHRRRLGLPSEGDKVA